jgi:hypothetical protein
MVRTDKLEQVLRRPEPMLVDEDFSAGVMRALPRRKLTAAHTGRWTLGAAALAGGLVTSLFGAPIEEIAGVLTDGSSSATWLIALLCAALLSTPVIWSLLKSE